MSTPTIPEGNPGRLNVLLLIGDAAHCERLRRRVRALGHHAEAVASVATARDHIESRMPDLILLDLRFDGDGSLPFLEELRRSPETRPLPVLVFGARPRSEAMERAYLLGASGPLAADPTADVESWIRLAMRYAGVTEAIA